MDFGSINKLVEIVHRRGPTAAAAPQTVFTTSVSSISGVIGQMIGGTTRTMAIQSACCAGLDSIGQAAEMIATGETDIALSGGTECPLYFHPMLELKLAGLAPGSPDYPERQCRPFDMWRTTGVIGEGACVLVLEPEESPRKGYAYVDGYAFASDPEERVAGGLIEAIRIALANGGVSPHSIECINAWGPGHKIIDAAEASALGAIFNSHLGSIPAVSLKGAIGNPLGAAGAMQTAAAAMGLANSAIPPTVNWDFPDPACPLLLSKNARYVEHRSTLVNAHGLSGSNACLILTR
jgi:3-oxoacyl-[acyl-carrier-protein] synthase II